MTDANGDRPRALVLLSGGLDSSIAIRLLLDQGVGVTALHFVSAFSPGTGKDGGLRARAVADELGVELIVRDATPDMLEFVANPRFGRGRNMNPCIDCRAYHLGVAKSMLGQTGASYVVTGEVLGQRPMSQHRGAMKRIEGAAGLEGLVLRPLTAHNLEPTAPEEKGWVDRERLLGISGRSRAEQNKLARMWGLKAHGTPAGGCLLTDRSFAWKLQDLLNYGDGLTAGDVHLWKLGRHFRLGPRARAVVGRNERENAKIVSYRAPGDWMLVAAAGSSPETLLRGDTTNEHLEAAARLTARYSKHRRLTEVEVVARPVESDGPEDRSWLPSVAQERTLRVAPAGEDEIAKLAIRRVGGTARTEELAPEYSESGRDVSGEEQVAEAGSEESPAEHLPVPVSKEGGGGPLVALRTRGLAEGERPGEVNKTFMGHLMELRSRIIICLVFLVLAVIAGLVFYDRINDIVMQPVRQYNAVLGEGETPLKI
ncbi:MAG: twin-arginine translocase subunit TatC, partial [Planctomycetota bacterium]